MVGKKTKNKTIDITHKSSGASNRVEPHESWSDCSNKMAAILYPRLCIRNSGRLGQDLH